MARGIDKAAVVAAALAVLDTGGIDAVTVRAVAAQLGVKAPALYYHVRDKQALLDEMGTEIHRRVVARLVDAAAPGRRPDQGWLGDLTAYAHALRAEYLDHRDGARTFSGTLVTDADLLGSHEPWLRRWVDAGVPEQVAFDAVEIVTAFVVGFVIEEQERAQSAAEPARYDPAERDRRLGPDRPLVAASARTWTADRFDRHLDVVLTGLDAAGRTRVRPTPP